MPSRNLTTSEKLRLQSRSQDGDNNTPRNKMEIKMHCIRIRDYIYRDLHGCGFVISGKRSDNDIGWNKHISIYVQCLYGC